MSMITGGKKKKTKIRGEKGITLIALIVTIIILLILAGVSIQMILGDQGLIKKAVEAVEKTEIADYEEQLELLGVELAMDEAAGGTQGSYTDKYKDKIEENFPGAHVTPKDDDSLVVETEEGHIYEVTEEGTDYLGEKGDEGLEPLPEGDIVADDIQITIDPTDGTWAKSVDVTMKIADENLNKFGIEYLEGEETTWHKYKNSFEVDETETIKARIVDALGDKAEVTTDKQIKNIDTVPPGDITISATPSEEVGIEVEATVTDGEKTEHSGQSGIAKISFQKEGDGDWTEGTMSGDDPSAEATGTHTFSDLTQDEDYTIKVKATDKAGNEKEGSITNKAIPDLGQANEGEITIEYKPAKGTWTKEKVHVTLGGTYVDNAEYTLEYATNYGTNGENATWQKYMKNVGFDVEANGQIGIRLKSKSGEQCGKPKVDTIDWIDKTAPTIDGITTTATTSAITVKVTANDDSGSGLNNTAPYAFSIYKGDKANGVIVQTEEASTKDTVTFSGLEDNTDYTVEVVVKDEVGNTATKIQTQKTNEVPGLTNAEDGDITISYTPSNWTKEPVTVTITKNIASDLELQYVIKEENDPLGGSETWNTYKESPPITVKNNGTTIYVRLWDGTNGGECATGTVANIDKIAPESVILDKKTEPTDSTVEVTATAADTAKVAKDSGVSGIGKFVFYYKEKDVAKDFIEVETKQLEKPTTDTAKVPQEYQYTELMAGKTYVLKVDAYDQANNKTESAELEVVTETTQEEIPPLEFNEPDKVTYADLDDDGEPDAVIYADLTKSGSGTWNPSNDGSHNASGTFSYDAATGPFKTYKVVKENHQGSFGTGQVIAAEGGKGADRFYAMGLENIGSATYKWCDDQAIPDYLSLTYIDFGKGKQNTETMLERYPNATTAAMWGLTGLKTKCTTGTNGHKWFVPSRNEWAAFGVNLGIDKSNWKSKGLARYYWSSSISRTGSGAWQNLFYDGYLDGDTFLSGSCSVRLSVTF